MRREAARAWRDLRRDQRGRDPRGRERGARGVQLGGQSRRGNPGRSRRGGLPSLRVHPGASGTREVTRLKQWALHGALSLAVWGLGGLEPAVAQPVDPAGARRFSAAEQIAIARAFAPRLVFHAEEKYFPISSMFLMPSERRAETDSTITSEGPGQLDSAAERAARYTQFSQQEKLARAAV